MLMMMLAAMLAAGTQPDTAGQPPCSTAQVKVSKTVEPLTDRSEQQLLPRSKAKAKEPSVLLPTCKDKADPKKKDYPLA